MCSFIVMLPACLKSIINVSLHPPPIPHLQVCLLECEGQISPSFTSELCKQAVKLSHNPTLPEGGALMKRKREELDMTSLDLNSELQQSVAASERLEEGDQEEEELPFEQRDSQYDSSLPESTEEEEGPQSLDLLVTGPREERNAGGDGQLGGNEVDRSEEVTLSKRFGGFQRGRHGYRKLIGYPARPLQKRYGGFIGVRKSARKWNNQKRVNQLLRQYLGLRSSRSGRFNSAPVSRVWRQNRL